MNLREHLKDETAAIVELIRSTFTDAAGDEEGTVVGRLAEELLAKTDPRELLVYVAERESRVVGTIFLSRLRFDHDALGYLLSPVAVATDHQRQGIGQALLRHGLDDLHRRGAEIVVTYGDPGYYQRVGFHPLLQETLRPPFPLSQPEGWLGQTLPGEPITTPLGSCACVEALNDPAIW